MISKGKHNKHPKIERSTIGAYHRSEWSIYGTTCERINDFYQNVSKVLDNLKFVYVDADHGNTTKNTFHQIGKKQFQSRGAQPWNEFDDKLNSFQSDAVLINGNHYPASKQIVIIDDIKKESLLRRIDELTNIDIVIINDSDHEIFDFVKLKMTTQTKIFLRSEIGEICNYISRQVSNNIPILKAVILAGGESKRMGIDKSQIIYNHGKSQEKYLYQLLEKKGIKTYISKAYNYNNSIDKSEDIIIDRFVKMGPSGAIMSAMMTDPNAAWLVIACDLPYLGEATIDDIINTRNPSKYATAIRGAKNPFPEPLIAIYEPRSYQRFLSFLSLGYACPRKILINSDIEEIILDNELLITNVNTPEQMIRAKNEINNG